MRNAGRVVERESLITSIWGGESDIESNTLDAFVRLLRSKVEQPGEPKLIHTVRGVGYCCERRVMRQPLHPPPADHLVFGGVARSGWSALDAGPLVRAAAR